MTKHVCVHCERALRVKKNGVTICEMFDDPPRPYALWSGDVYECPECEREVATQFGMRPIALHHQSSFARTLERAQDRGVVVYAYERGWAS